MILIILTAFVLNTFVKRFHSQFSVNENMQADNLIMCGYFCIGFINCMPAGKTLIDFISLLSPDDFKKSDK